MNHGRLKGLQAEQDTRIQFDFMRFIFKHRPTRGQYTASIGVAVLGKKKPSIADMTLS